MVAVCLHWQAECSTPWSVEWFSIDVTITQNSVTRSFTIIRQLICFRYVCSLPLVGLEIFADGKWICLTRDARDGYYTFGAESLRDVIQLRATSVTGESIGFSLANITFSKEVIIPHQFKTFGTGKFRVKLFLDVFVRNFECFFVELCARLFFVSAFVYRWV